MNNVNIFDSAKPQEGEFFAFKNFGDQIQGTYIGKRDMMSRTYGNMQTLYILSDKDGKIWNVAFNKEKAVITHERMAGIRLGQIVGFKYEADKPAKVAGYHPTKIIRIYADPMFVDQAWIDQQKTIQAQYDGTSIAPVASATVGVHEVESEDGNDGFGSFSAPVGAGPAAGLPTGTVAPRNEALDAIRQLARTKGLTNDSMSEAEADKAIETYASLALTEENLTKIIILLTRYVSK